MKVIILCGGLGTHHREETALRPKSMVPIGRRPILWHIMKHNARFGQKEFKRSILPTRQTYSFTALASLMPSPVPRGQAVPSELLLHD